MTGPLHSWTLKAVVVCIKPAQDQVNQHPNMIGGGAYEPPPLAEELSTIESFGGKENWFSLRVLLLVGQSSSSYMVKQS